jgi:hypothetical protein
MTLSTTDNDPKGCAAANMGAGWYGPDCTGFSVFSKLNKWPILPGQNVTYNYVNICLVRTSDFYINM